VAVTANGKYIKQNISSIVTDSQEFQEEQWFLEEREEDPEYI